MGQKFKKSPGQKKLVKSNKSISRKNFLTKFHFLPFQKWPKINFWTRKKFKTAKNAISRKKFFNYLISRVFLPGLFLIFWPIFYMFRIPTTVLPSYKVFETEKKEVNCNLHNTFWKNTVVEIVPYQWGMKFLKVKEIISKLLLFLTLSLFTCALFTSATFKRCIRLKYNLLLKVNSIRGIYF